MKHSFSALVLSGALAAALLLAGCSKAPADSMAPRTTPADSSAETTPEAPAGVEATVTGDISNGAMHSFTLTPADGTALQVLLTDDTVLNLPDGILDGIAVTVTGLQDGDQLTAATVEAVTVYSTLTGTVSDAAMHSFTLTMDDDTTVQILQDDDTVLNLADGMLDGITVVVEGIQQGDAILAATITDAALAAAQTTLTGVVSNASMHSFTLTMPDGSTTQILLDDDTETTLTDGMKDGITVTATGSPDGDTLLADSITQEG